MITDLFQNEYFISTGHHQFLEECRFLELFLTIFLPSLTISEQVMPETPVPDYGDAATPENQNVFKFAQKFQTVLTNIQKIGICFFFG
jgi:hypothetical protein